MSTTKTTTTSLASEELAAALTAVIPMAGVDDTLPVLCAVKFEAADKVLTLATTDRYTVGTYRLDWDGPDVDALLALRDAKELLAFAKKAKRIPLQLTFTDDELAVSDWERKATYRLMDAEFPRWRALMPTIEDDYERFGVNPVFIGKFAAATDKKHADTLILSRRVGSLKPIRVDVGERFTGLIMPVRLPDQAVRPEPVKVPEPVAEVAPEPEVEETTPEPEPEDSDDFPAYHEDEPAADESPVTGGDDEKCGQCKGYGLVRGVGSHAGDAYKTLNGAQTSANAVQCPVCKGEGAVEVAA